MKKNYFFGISAMAAMMLATSCQEEDVVKQVQEAAEATVSINVTTPELGAATRTFGDGETAQTLHYAVYNVKGEGENRTRTYLPDLTVENHEFVLETTVDLQLVTGNTYDVIFWADNDNAPYTINWNNEVDGKAYPTVSIDYSNVTSNNEDYDAFFDWMTITVDASKSVSIDLERPFAQLNIGTSDIEEAKKAGYALKQTQVKVKNYSTLNIWDKSVADAVLVDFKAADYPNYGLDANSEEYEKFTVDGYEYMAMNYLLRPTDKELEDVEFYFYSEEGEEKYRKYASVPLRRNWRTNIYGQLITSDVDVFVEIVPGFDGAYDREVWDGHTLKQPAMEGSTVLIYQAAELAYVADAINGGGQSNAAHAPATRSSDVDYAKATIKLMNNIDLGGENWTPIAGFEGTFDGQEYHITNLRVNTEGKASAGLFAATKGTIKNLTVRDAVIIGHYKAGVIAGDGLCGKFENCHVENATVLSTPYNNDDANHVGGIVGYLSGESTAYVKNSSVKNATITGYRDVAGIAGTANKKAVVTGNVVENVTITADQTAEYVEVKAANAGAVVGRKHADATVDGNTDKAVDVIIKVDNFEEVQAAGGHVTLVEGEYTATKSVDINTQIKITGGKVVVKSEDNVTISSGSESDYGFVATGAGSSLIVENASIYSKGGGVGVTNGANVVFNGGDLNINSKSTSGRYLFYLAGDGSTVTINGGNFDFDKTQNQKRAYIYASAGTTVYVKGGTFGKASTRSGYTAGILGDGEVIVTGGTFGFDPTAWLAFGYVAKKDGQNWVVENALISDTEVLKEQVATEGATVFVSAGEYTFPGSSVAAGVTINCAEGVVFTGTTNLNIKGATVVGATFSNPGGTAVNETINGTFKNCTFEGTNGVRWAYAGETVVFEDCVFSGSTYGVHFDGGANDVIFRNCTISGFNALAGAIEMVTFEGCTFKSNGKSGYNGANLWGSAKMVDCEFTFDGSCGNEWIDCIGADKAYEFVNCTVNGAAFNESNFADYNENIFSRNNVMVKINGVDCQF